MAKHRLPPIARIRLARSLPRLLAWPAIVIGTGLMAGASWWLGSFGSGAGGVVFAVLGGVLVIVGLAVAVLLLSVRLEVQEAAIRLSWFGGERIYLLTRGPVTRVRLRGPEASSLRPRFGMFGWALGGARLRDDEEIHVVRLARTPTAILVPTERGRLAIAAADENALLDALSHAARARQRLESIAGAERPSLAAPVARDPAAEPETRAVLDAEQQPVPEPEPEPEAGPESEAEGRFLTGIERALLEQRLAEERAATAEGEPGSDGSEPLSDNEQPAAVPAPSVEAEVRVPHRSRPSLVFVLLPLLAAGIAWAVGTALGTYPEPDSDAGRLTALALVLAGPATSVGAIMARTWWPRLVGVVVVGGLIASVFVGRALLG